MMSEVNPALFEGMQYRQIGPLQGGRVTTVTGVPSQPRTFYMGVASGGLWRTTDGGESWEPITAGKVPVGSSGAVAVADSDPNVIYYGTGIRRFAQQRLDGARRVSILGRRRDLVLRGALRRGPDRGSADPPHRPEHGLGRRERRRLQALAGTGHLQDHRRGSNVAQYALRVRQHRRDGRRDPARESRCGLRLDEPHRAQTVDDHQRLP